MIRPLGAYDAIDIWDEPYYDEAQADERRAEAN
jgi:hypothetical protein